MLDKKHMTFKPLYFLLLVLLMTTAITGTDASEQKERLSLPSETSKRLALGIKVKVDEPEQGRIADKTLMHCEEPRPQVCTMDYKPVCAQILDGDFKTYSNGCTACADPNVTAYSDGACEE